MPKIKIIEEQSIINNLNFLLSHAHVFPGYLEFSAGKVSANQIFKSKSPSELKNYLQSLINLLEEDLTAEPQNRKYSPFLPILLQKLIHQNPNNLIEQLNLAIPELLKRKIVLFEKKEFESADNSLHNLQHLVFINYNPKTGYYASPDDNLAHQHSVEALRIFISTQIERLKGFISRIFAKIGLYVFESAIYKEHDYLHTDIYANDLAVDPYQPQVPSHFFDGHATNLITVPTSNTPLTSVRSFLAVEKRSWCS